MVTTFDIVALSVIVPVLFLLVQLTSARLLRRRGVRIGFATGLCLVAEFVAIGGLTGAAGYWGSRQLSWVRGRFTERYRRSLEIETSKLMRDLAAQPKYQDPRRLALYEAKVYSQYGEDGILAEILRRVGTTNRTFVEFGSADGMENNTVLLLRLGWNGLWMDGDEEAITRAREYFAPEIRAKQLKAETAFITAENIEELFAAHGVPIEFDVLSIDIDYNDYHVWKALKSYKPRVVVIEYNSMFPPGVEWVAEYRPDAVWDMTSKFGASLSAMESLGRQKGYTLVGSDVVGLNAFFVRNDLVKDKFCPPFTAQNHYEPTRYWMLYGGYRRVP